MKFGPVEIRRARPPEPRVPLRYCQHEECYDDDGHWEGCFVEDDDMGIIG